MRWKRGASTRDVIDVRGGAAARRRGGMALPIGGGAGILGVIVFARDPAARRRWVGRSRSRPASTPARRRRPASRSRPARTRTPSSRTSPTYVFNDVQGAWTRTFAAAGRPYERAKVVFYDGAVDTACGSATSAVGPFYCPADRDVYLDLSFYDDMERQLGASGDFAWAYVIAHEVGHHVQQQLGTSAEVDKIRRSDPDKANERPCGWSCRRTATPASGRAACSTARARRPRRGAHGVRGGRRRPAAARGGGAVNPDSFTHGSSEQRRRWFERGRERGEPADCDTFGAEEL